MNGSSLMVVVLERRPLEIEYASHGAIEVLGRRESDAGAMYDGAPEDHDRRRPSPRMYWRLKPSYVSLTSDSARPCSVCPYLSCSCSLCTS